MKAAITVFLVLIIFPSVSHSQDFTLVNGTVFCDGAEPGDTGMINGITYEALDRQMLDQKIATGEDVTKVCTSLITYMGNLFAGKEDFNQDIGSWDVSNVIEMPFMFSGAITFNQDIGNWDVSNVMNMAGMFIETHNFNQDIGSWDVSGVRDMAHMFKVSRVFNQDISGWDVSNVMHMGWMFKDSYAFNQDIGNWNVSSVRNMSGMFSYSKAFNRDLSTWCVDNFDSEPDDFRSGGSSLSESNVPNWGSCVGKPDEVTMEFPLYQEENVSTTPTFFWHPVQNIDHYQFRIMHEDLPYLIDTLLTDTTFSMRNDLELDEFYYWQVRAIHGNASGEWSSPTYFKPSVQVANEYIPNPEEFTLHQNYPNPFNPSTDITYQLPENSLVVLKVYDLLGQEVAELVNTHQASGSHSITFDASGLSSGVYFYILQTEELTLTKKMLLVK